jgi:hypothetical protein
MSSEDEPKLTNAGKGLLELSSEDDVVADVPSADAPAKGPKRGKSVRLCITEIDEETGNMIIYDESGGGGVQDQSLAGRKGRLTVCSEKYDIGNKGYLDPVELAMRKADKEGKGELVSVLAGCSCLLSTSSSVRVLYCTHYHTLSSFY